MGDASNFLEGVEREGRRAGNFYYDEVFRPLVLKPYEYYARFGNTLGLLNEQQRRKADLLRQGRVRADRAQREVEATAASERRRSAEAARRASRRTPEIGALLAGAIATGAQGQQGTILTKLGGGGTKLGL